MPIPGDYQVDIWHKTGATYGSLSYSASNANASKLMDYEWTFLENRPKQLKVMISNLDLGVYNLLDASFNAWSNGVVGAVDNGDLVAFALCPLGQTALQYIFYGIVTDVQPDIGNRTLTLVCNDKLIRYEDFKSDAILFNQYRDRLITSHALTTNASYYALLNINDPNIALPFVNVEFAQDDSTIDTFGSLGDPAHAISFQGGPLAQSFIANSNSDALLGVRVFIINNGGYDHTLTVNLREDDGTGKPSSANLVTGTCNTIYENSDWHTVTLYSGSGPYPLIAGKKYWFVFSIDSPDAVCSMVFDPATPYPDIPYYDYYNGASWVPVSSASLCVHVDLTKYTSIAWKDCVWDPTNHQLFVKVTNKTGALGYQIWRGRVSYYYGLVTAASIAASLTGLDGPINNADVPQTFAQASTYLNTKTFPIFRTKGSYVADCMRELCDNYCVSIGGVYYQAVVAPYNSLNAPSGTNYLKWSRRLILTDTSARTFSTDPTSPDDQLRVVDSSGLRKTSKRPASVMVIGQDSSGLPIVAHRDDFMNDRHIAGTSFRNKSGRLLTDTVTDTGINTLQQANEIAQSRLDMVVRDSWEGQIIVSGDMPDLADVDPTSNTYGSGKIITLNIPEGGIFSQKFKVRGLILKPGETTIQLTNYGILVANNFTAAYLNAKKTETFLAPTNADTNVFMKLLSGASLAGSGLTNPVFMELRTGSATMPSSVRVRCTAFADPTRHQFIYHAEFEAGNGLSSSGSNWVTGAALWTDQNAGVVITTGSVGASYYVPKWSGTRLIIDFAAWDGS